ncbi:SAM-dependent methyltransferase [Clostridium saccharoperbutylacetonicum]|uniref:SAM-dependent methyltransferase n=1 Tax=Clostridium saccharoperbutylacetonicum TaxID=36745 RepID=UPI000983B12C|nr:cyclopropane-fatty-acyl-phospholipid synthase family protein [Clostridium saccharoperbutylacetonicum]AQR94343.1 cyclopropane-fatty-acyl-phospholipid synthase [Clostridium saccharoperbutylacetonicum]NSB30042.1 cyclopropane-fatty-acyl-phospholipid synthase [Clostridium saccharoperbutylacetonicum]
MSFINSFYIKYLEKFDDIPFKVKFQNNEEYVIGEGTPQFEITVKNEISKTELLKSTSIALGEAYMRGDIEIQGDLFQVLNLFLSQMDKFTTDAKSLKNLIFTSSSPKNQKSEVQSHYDIGNNFYSLWLDDTMTYSCGYFKSDNDSLHDAQINKINHSLKKLNLKEGMSLLDIGCGWGSLLIEAAKKYKVHGLGITLSEEQFKKCNERIKEEKLENLLEVKLMDYRDLIKSGKGFDRVISIGMLEHVGRENYELFIKNVDGVLKPEGVFLLHYISALKEYPGDPWIKKYVFKGGVIPSLREIINICGDYKFYVIDVESLRRHYVKTLLCWRDNYNKNIDKISKMFNQEFVRMWELYLSSCAATFNNGIIDLHQILITKGLNNNIPMTRDYLY